MQISQVETATIAVIGVADDAMLAVAIAAAALVAGGVAAVQSRVLLLQQILLSHLNFRVYT